MSIKKKYPCVGIFCLMLFLAERAAGQHYIHSIHHFSIEEGLPHRLVHDVQQDDLGYIWLASEAGLFRFDGYSFLQVPLVGHGIPHQLLKDANGCIWVSMDYQRRIEVLDPEKLRTVSFDDFFAGKAPVRQEEISLTQLPESVLWIESEQGVCFTYDGEFHQKLDLRGSPFLHPDFPVKPSGDGTFWLCKNRELVEIGSRADVFQSFALPSVSALTAISVDRNNRVWVASSGIFQDNLTVPTQLFFIEKGRKELLFERKASLSNKWFNDPTLRVAVDQSGLTWTWAMNFCAVLDSTGQTRLDVASLLKSAGKVDIKQLFIDRHNQAWIASSDGVFLISLRKNPFQTYLKVSQGHSSFRGMAEDNFGNLYLQRYEPGNAVKLDLPSGASSPAGFPLPGVGLCIWKDRNEEVYWVAGHHPGVFRHEPKTGFTVRFPFLDVPKGEVNAICRDSRTGRLWVGAVGGLAWVDSVAGQVVSAKTQFPDLFDVPIFHFYENGQGLWAATNEGLFLIDPEKQTSREFSTATSDLPFDAVTHIFEDKKTGVFWLATKGGGLLEWNRNQGTCRQYTTSEGLPNNFIHAVYESAARTLWLSSDNGLIRFDKINKKVEVFTTNDGLSCNEFNFLSHLRTGDGRLWFGGVNGLVAFAPEDILPAPFDPPPLHFTLLEVLNGKTQTWENRTEEALENQAIALHSADQSLTLKVTLLDYVNPAGNRYFYYIEGFDERKVQMDGNTIRLGGLPYGEFLLVVEAQGRGWIGSHNRLSIPIFVERPFFRTWWFGGLALAVLGALIFAIIRGRTYQLRKQKARLEQEVAVRSAEILMQNQQLEEVNATKDQLFSIISHELKDHATSFLSIAQKVNYLLQKKQPERLLQLGDHIEQSARNLEGLLSNLLTWAVSQRNGMISSPEPVSLQKLTVETLAVFQSAAELKGVRFEICVPAEAVVFADKIALATVLRNLVGNAIKFSPKGNMVQVWADKTESGSVELIVQDYGIGISPEKLEKLFAIYRNKSTSGTAGEKGAGVGLALCQSLVGMNNGTIHVESEVGKGTRVRVNLAAAERMEIPLETTGMENLQPA